MTITTAASPSPSSLPTLTLASFNVDGIRARQARLTDWLERHRPHVVALQEIKCQDDQFPHEALESAGYRAITHGQKGFNGVAILYPVDGPVPTVEYQGLPNMPDDKQARYIAVCVAIGNTEMVVASVYLPNGNPVDRPEKFDYKLKWMAAFFDHVADLKQRYGHVALLGDFNVAPTSRDLFNPDMSPKDALSHADVRRLWRQRTRDLNLCDAWRVQNGLISPGYTEYSYQYGRFFKGQGFRIDFALLSPTVANWLDHCTADYNERSQSKASNHLPLVCRLHARETLP